MKKRLDITPLGFYLLTLVLLCWGMVCLIWQVQNPKANRMTCVTYFDDVIHLRKLEKFQ